MSEQINRLVGSQRTGLFYFPGSLTPKTVIRLGYLNIDYLSSTKLNIIKLNLESDKVLKDLDVLILAEVGNKLLKTLEEDGWIISKEAKTKAEGLAIKINKKLRKSLVKITQLSSRNLALTFKLVKGTFTVIATYGPTSNHGQEKYLEHLKEIDTVLQKQFKHQTVIIGDLNAKIKRKLTGVTGNFGLHCKNSKQGELLASFCFEKGLRVVNSYFKTAKKNRSQNLKQAKHATFRLKDLSSLKIISELDLILTKKEHLRNFKNFKINWNFIKKVRSKAFDHALISCEFILRSNLKPIKNLKNTVNKVKFIQSLKSWSKVEQILEPQRNYKANVENFKDSVHEVFIELIKKAKKEENNNKKNKIERNLTERAKVLLVQREKATTKIKINKINEELRKEGLKSYEEFLENTAKQIEIETSKNNLKKSYFLINKMLGKKQKYQQPNVDLRTNKLYNSKQEVVEHFADFYEDLFSKNPNLKNPFKDFKLIELEEVNVDCSVPTNIEIYKTLKTMKKNKACGPDNISTENLLKSNILFQNLVKTIQKIWKTGKIEQEFAKGTTIMIHKRKDSNKIENYRPITLLNHAFKIFTKIINNRLKKLVETNVLNSQNGFRSNRTTSDSYVALQKILEQSLHRNQQLIVLFIDLKKAFDKISKEWLIFALFEHQVPFKIIKLIIEMYDKASIQIKSRTVNGDVFSRSINIYNGVLQGDSLSPTLFILALDSIMRRLPEVKNKLTFADDIASQHTTVKSLIETLKGIHTLAEYSGLNISLEKTKLMWVRPTPKITIDWDDVVRFPLKYPCPTCIRTFETTKGLALHVNRCKKEKAHWTDVLKNKKSPNYKALVEKKKAFLVQQNDPDVYFNGIKLNNVEHFKYLGVYLKNDSNMTLDMKIKVARGHDKLKQALKLFKTTNLRKETKKIICKAIIVSMVLYGSETWNLRDTTTKKSLNQMSRTIKRYISTDIQNFKQKVQPEDIDLLEIAKERQNKFIERIEQNKTSPAYQMVINQRNNGPVDIDNAQLGKRKRILAPRPILPMIAGSQ